MVVMNCQSALLFSPTLMRYLTRRVVNVVVNGQIAA
eukprot:COSAG02_NODE_19343_length_886_cov_1.675985_2_plen_35_part_01